MRAKKSIILVDKPVGITPLEAIKKFQKENYLYGNEKIGYAGRLDPMASGVLVLLVGEENKKINDYMGLDKEYVAEILFGMTSDSYDVLGIAEKTNGEAINILRLKKEIAQLKSLKSQKLPAFSSYRINGKPLFYYALHNQLDKIKIPSRKIKIKSVKLESIRKIISQALLKQIFSKLSLVKGNFRTAKIKAKWKKLLLKDRGSFVLAKITLSCSSGTYIRSIADFLGKKMKTGALLFSLKRTRVGRFRI